MGAIARELGMQLRRGNLSSVICRFGGRRRLNRAPSVVCWGGGFQFMLDAFLRRAILVALISALPNVVSVASAHGGHSGGSNGGGHSSSSSGMGTSSGTSGGHSSTASKGGHSDPVSVSQSSVGHQAVANHPVHPTQSRRIFFQHGSTGYNAQNTAPANDDWRRRHQHLLFGFIPIY